MQIVLIIAEVISAQDYSPFGAPLPGRSKALSESASGSVVSQENFSTGTSGWTTSGTHSVLTGNYYGQLAATITGRGSDSEGMKKTFATEEGKQYKVTFTINTIGWPSFRVQDSLNGDNILATGMQLPGTYSYTFVARGSRTTLYFEEVEAVNSTLVLSSLLLFEEGKSSGYRFGFNGQERDDEVSGAGNTYTAEFWEYDARLGRRFNIDPITRPWESPYACFAGNPIYNTDVNGDDPTPSGKPIEPIYPTPDGKAPMKQYTLPDFVVQSSRVPVNKPGFLANLWQGIKQAVSSIGHAILGAEFAYMSNNIPAMSIARFGIDAQMDPADPNVIAIRVGELVGDAITFVQGLEEGTGGSALAIGSEGVLAVPGIAISVHGAALTVSSASHIAHTVYLMSDLVHNKSTEAKEGTSDKEGVTGKNEKHGDGGRALTKAEKQIQQLEEQVKTAKGTEKARIKKKIQNITQDALRKRKGEEHSRANKR
jgi:hypothetical protein